MINRPLTSAAPQQLVDKVAVVLGASTGIGAATAQVLAEAGAHVVLGSRNVAAIEGLAMRIEDGGGSARAVAVDVERPEQVSAAIALAVKDFGGVDILVNNAGINVEPHPIDEVPDEEFDRVIGVNLKGVWNGMRAAIPELRVRGGGAIVNVASVGGLVGAPGIGPYCASKHAVIGLSKSAALDLAAAGIRVNVVAPGAVDTAIFNDWQEDPVARADFIARHPLGRIGEPVEIGHAIAWLASSSASFVTGAVLPIDGGYTVP